MTIIGFSPKTYYDTVSQNIHTTDNLERIVDKLQSLDNFANLGADGWVDDGNVWTYVSATSFTIQGDLTSIFGPGLKLKLTQTTVKYFYVTAVSFSAGVTTVTITGGSDYSLANAAITNNFYSFVENPDAFPPYFNFTATFVGFSADPTYIAHFKLIGKTCYYHMMMTANGTSNATGFTVTAPFTALNIANNFYGTLFWTAVDNGVTLTTPGRVFIGANSNVITLQKDLSSAAWTNVGGKRADFELIYEIN